MSDVHTFDSKRFRIRPAVREDAEAMTEVYYRSFTQIFWKYFTPDDAVKRAWWDESWRLGIDNPTDESFVVEDTKNNNRIVAFSRWMKPQTDGNLERKWPEVNLDEWDMEVAGPFFGGMEHNREVLMEKRPHWMLEMLGVDEEYQRHGIAGALMRWGTKQADAAGLETYLDGSEVGQPWYVKNHKFEIKRDVPIPDRPEYGTFLYKSLVRPPQKKA